MTKVLRKTLLSFIIGFLTIGMAAAQQPLLIPGTLSGTDITLNLQNGTYQFYQGINTTTMGANGNILGPTLVLDKGQQVNITVNNQLADTTTIHWHGMHVSASNDGGPHTTIAPGTSWHPAFTVMDKAGTYWYHPHLHTKTNKHVSLGIAGMIIVKDEEEASLDLPRTYGVDDFPLVIQTKDFDADKQIVVPSNSDDVVMVNATIDPYLDVPAQVVRFRLLNGSSQRVFKIGLSGNNTFYQIASDGGLLSEPLALTRLQLAPGERAELLIDFTGKEGQSLQLMSYAAEFPNGIYGATNPGMMSNMTLNGYKPNPINGANFNIITFNVGSMNNNPVTSIPAQLVTLNPIPESEATTTRQLTFTPEQMGPNQLNGKFLINGVSFNMDVINYSIPLGNTEIWVLKNQSAIAHPFHIHDVQFYVLDRNGVAPPPEEQGRKDVILVKPQETVRFIASFDDFANDSVPYMYHCHMLTHEDMGMMGQFEVVDNTTGVNNNNIEVGGVTIYPNPSMGDFLTVTSNESNLRSITIYGLTGEQLLKRQATGNNLTKIDVSTFTSGLYLIKIETEKGDVVKKVVIK